MAMAPGAPPSRSAGTWGNRFKRMVRERFLLRFHMTLILAVVALAGLIANKLLFGAAPEMVVRYPLSVLASYLAFFGCVQLWIAYVRAATPPSLRGPAVASALAGAAALAGPQPPRRHEQHAGDVAEVGLDVADGVSDGVDLGLDGAAGVDDGVVLLVFAVVVLAVVAAGGWLIWEAPVILSEVAFSAALAGSLGRTAWGEAGPHWAWSLLRKTAIPFTVVAVLSAGAGFTAQQVCPQAQTVRQALNCEP